MWQRHTHPRALPGTSRYSAAGWGSCTRHTSHPPESSRAFISLYRLPGLPLLLVEVLRGALQRVVHQLGRVEEFLAPVDHLPLALQAHVAHQRHERVQDLRHAPAERRRGDVHHPAALQRLRQLADLVDQVPPADVRVVGERLGGDGDGLEHARTILVTAAAEGAGSAGPTTAPPTLCSASVLNGRIYRAGFLPLLLALVVAGFSLTGRTAPLSLQPRPRRLRRRARLRPLQGLAQQFPDRAPRQRRRPGARRVRGADPARARQPRRGRFRGHHAQLPRRRRSTGERTLTTVIAQRPGTTGEAPLVILAHRDAAGPGAEAELSGTAALLELARVLAAGETQRTIVLVSTSGGSGGNAGAADFAAHAGELLLGGGGSEEGASGAGRRGHVAPLDAALVLGDLAGTRASGPLVASFSGGRRLGARAAAEHRGGGARPAGRGRSGAPRATLAQLAHLVFPLPAGEQAPLDARGLPAVLLGAGGEQPPAGGRTGQRRAAGSASGGRPSPRCTRSTAEPEVGGGEAGRGPRNGAADPAARRSPRGRCACWWRRCWLPALLVLGDGLARLRRRSEPGGAVGGVGAGVRAPVPRRRALRDRCWARSARSPRPARRSPPRRYRSTAPRWRRCSRGARAGARLAGLAGADAPARALPCRPVDEDAAALGPLLVLGALAVGGVGARARSPRCCSCSLCTCGSCSPPRYAHRAGRVPLGALGLVALGVAPLALLVAFYAAQLDLGLGGVAHTAAAAARRRAHGGRGRGAVERRLRLPRCGRCWSRSPRRPAERPRSASRRTARRARGDQGPRAAVLRWSRLAGRHGVRPAAVTQRLSTSPPSFAHLPPSAQAPACTTPADPWDRPCPTPSYHNPPSPRRGRPRRFGRRAPSGRRTPAGRALRALSTALIVRGGAGAARRGRHARVAGAVLGAVRQAPARPPRGALRTLERARPTALERTHLRALVDERRRVAFLARQLARHAALGSAVGSIRIPRMGADFVLVYGTGVEELERGPGIYTQSSYAGHPLPRPGRHDRDRRPPHHLPCALPSHRRAAPR